MMMLWSFAGLPLGVYNIVENFNIALRIQPQILTTLSLITWSQCYYYGKKWPIHKTLFLTIPIALALGGAEVGLIVALRIAKQRDRTWPITLMAVLSAVLLAAGVLRHYWDIYTHRTVRGISFIFVGIDAGGDLTSLISVLFQPKMNILGLVIYGTELILWIGVFACGGYFNFVPWVQQNRRARRRERAEELNPRIGNEINLNELPSSTSVFRTPSQIDVVNSEGLSERVGFGSSA
jgi:PQ loop repeat